MILGGQYGFCMTMEMRAKIAAIRAAQPMSPCGSSLDSSENAMSGRNDMIRGSGFMTPNLGSAGQRNIGQPADLFAGGACDLHP